MALLLTTAFWIWPAGHHAVDQKARAQSAVAAEHHYTFGQTATFSFKSPTTLGIKEANLYLRINEEQTQLYTESVEEGTGEYRRDLRQTAFPPFARISYWWEYTTDQGNSERTPKVEFLYEDNRFDWLVIQEDNITLKWVAGERATMVVILDILKSAATDIQYALQTPPLDELAVYIYPSPLDLQSALRLTLRDWVGGHANPEVGVLLLAMSANDETALKMNNDVPHELTHKLLYDLTGPQGYDNLPIWLSEGLASHFERSPEIAYALALENASQQASLHSLESLCYTFPIEHEQVILAYAQSQSIVSYIQQTYGWSRVRALIDSYTDGMSCSAGVNHALGRDLSTLEREWRIWLEQEGNPADGAREFWTFTSILLRDLAPWIMLTGLLLLPGFAVLISSVSKR